MSRLGGSDLAPLRLPRSDLMTIITAQLLRGAVFSMTKIHAKCRGPLGSSRVTAELVTSAARRNIPAAGPRARRMTAIASRMRAETDRNRQRDAAPCRTVAGSTTHIPHIQVSRVIEDHAEALQPRKRLHCAGTHVSMANRADRTVSVRKLRCVTSGAGCVPRSARQIGPWGIAFASMTQQTWHARVIGARMKKL